jgi:hypothetical protein
MMPLLKGKESATIVSGVVQVFKAKRDRGFGVDGCVELDLTIRLFLERCMARKRRTRRSRYRPILVWSRSEI